VPKILFLARLIKSYNNDTYYSFRGTASYALIS